MKVILEVYKPMKESVEVFGKESGQVRSMGTRPGRRPPRRLPSYFRALANAFPPTWGIDIVRDVLVLNRGLEILPRFIELVIATVIIFTLGVVAYKKTLRRYAEL